ncbi:MAG TPA: tRNA epoxyqueuosine(34) reductase QueG [Rhizomicrobium sp.]|nr:tRNA epoxyqueuosine(34) reductase QueG [Rhizomicrobium sp.]
MPNSIFDPVAAIRAKAREEGFDVVRFAKAQPTPQAGEYLTQFIAEGRHGTMDWLAREPSRRADPQTLWPEAQSIIVLGTNYGPSDDPFDKLVRRQNGNISVYAQGEDYHDVLKTKLKRVAGFLHEKLKADVKVFIDTAPVMEKPLAQRAGIGWQGKHTNLVSREFGSWLFIGSIFTTLDLPADAPEADHCGQCHRCLDVCPTNAFTAPYQLDARRCISYLTIEHKGHIASEFRVAIGNRIYGCDDCLAVCPWNKFAQVSRESAFHAREELRNPALVELSRLDDTQFRALFRRSPIKRTGRDRFVRNVLIAAGNSGEHALVSEAERLLDDASPLVRAMAVWSLARLDPDRAQNIRTARMAAEPDEDVRNEWREISPPV